jgi:GT2 family glycosyltransferase
MLERFDAHGSIGLVSWQPWDPPRLRTGNYIDAMALLRADVLRSHRGYTTDRRLHGWEDYDLWCRIAESGGRGVLVPEIVARYRVSRHSMLSLTDISSTTAYSVLIERCPRLMQGIRPPL